MLDQLVLDCRQGFGDVTGYLQEFKDWAAHVAQWRLPRIVEARRRLRVVHSRLDKLFEREKVIVDQLAQRGDRRAVSIDDMRERAENDRLQLRQSLTALILRLERASTEFEDWRPVLYELSLFVDAVEQHRAWFCGCVRSATSTSETVSESGD